jgi:hypothetical protein
VSECEWKLIYWLVESITSFEVSECGWEFINWLSEIIPSCKMSKWAS